METNPVMLTLKLLRADMSTGAVSSAENEVNLVYTSEYQEGDSIVLEASESGRFLMFQADDALGSALVYVKGDSAWYTIPFGEKRICYSPKPFSGNRHLISVRVATDEEINSYRNLALNVMDQQSNTFYFPHAHANVETREESVFAARNVIDGVKESRSHGEWPYQSWGINQRADAEITIEFGREVSIDKVTIYLRADFPHDNWWKQVTLRFSDNETMVCDLIKTGAGQTITFEKRTVEWIRLEQLIKSDEPSPFPALTQFEVYGTEA
ncbi:discoidin domain-containing protein [Pontiellaceae bacterium B1224]|nr:discoidin domain-containing protein [Pontiellaceae bacterium B1224]